MKESQNNKGWYQHKEAARTTFPIFLTLWTLRHFPRWFTNFVAYCSSLFYWIFNDHAKNESRRFQNAMKEFVNDNNKFKPRPFRQLTAFAVTFVEKVECWTKELSIKNIHFNEDASDELKQQLNEGKGAFIFVSHLGNFETLRCFANANNIDVKREVPLAILSDVNFSSNFSKALQKMNPDFTKNIVDVNNISPATIIYLQEVIEKGGMVVCSGDRISKNEKRRIIMEDFLGKPAPFSYGSFYLAMLVGAPVYYIYAFRKKDIVLDSRYEMYVEKSMVPLEGPRKEREERISKLCREFAANLQKYALKYPYQWFNFFDFWAVPETTDED